MVHGLSVQGRWELVKIAVAVDIITPYVKRFTVNLPQREGGLLVHLSILHFVLALSVQVR